jgi:manganese transport protein
MISGDQRCRFAFLGAATLVSVGYIDPGNWATDLEGGSRFGYDLLWVLVASGLLATLLQTLSARLGVVTGLDLARACRAYYGERLRMPLWLLAEIAIVACDMAEVIGSALALNLLFGIPIFYAALLTAADVFLILALQHSGVRSIEIFIAGLVVIIAGCLGTQLLLARPALGAVAQGLVPRLGGDRLYLAVGILGATVMPHNLYLQSAIVPRTPGPQTYERLARRLLDCLVSTAVALSVALVLNAAILLVAASVFFTRGIELSDLREAHSLLAPLMGTSLASALFAIALLCSGQSSTITGTLAGQVVMEGFMTWHVSPVYRRAITRGLAILPTLLVLWLVGERGTLPLLVTSQIVLSLQLPFAIVPLVRFTNSTSIMGCFANRRWIKIVAISCVLLVGGANAALVAHWVSRLYAVSALHGYALGILALAALCFLGWISWVPLAGPSVRRDGSGDIELEGSLSRRNASV